MKYSDKIEIAVPLRVNLSFSPSSFNEFLYLRKADTMLSYGVGLGAKTS